MTEFLNFIYADMEADGEISLEHHLLSPDIL